MGAWNTVGFEGGGMAMEFMTTGFLTKGKGKHGFTGSEVVTSHSMLLEDEEVSHWFDKEWDTEHLIFVVTLDIDGGYSYGDTRQTTREIMVDTFVLEDSNTMFHLEDPDNGDYFVVSVWADPDYGTPLLSLDGGASICQWEVGTAHKSAPQLSWECLSGDVVKADDPVMFKVKLMNTINYYQSGPSSKYREGWMGMDTGYVPANLELFVDPATVQNGLQVSTSGHALFSTIYAEFGKQSIDVLVEVTRGPNAYTYDPPVLGWRVACGAGVAFEANGDGKYNDGVINQISGRPFYALHMPNDNSNIEYTAPCPRITWAGKFLTNPHFTILADDDPGTIDVKVRIFDPNSADSKPSRAVYSVFINYRRQRDDNGWEPWQPYADRIILSKDISGGRDTSSIYFGETWILPPSLKDGKYELRAVVECTADASSDGFDTSLTAAVINGLIARTPPKVLRITSSLAIGSSGGKQEAITVTLSKQAVCHDSNNGKLPPTSVKSAGSILTNAVISCADNVVLIGITKLENMCEFDVDGIADVAGNALPTFRIVFVGTTCERRQRRQRRDEMVQYIVERGGIGKAVEDVDSKVDTNYQKMDTKVGEVDTKVSEVDTKVGAIDTKVGAVDTKVGEVDTKVDEVDTKVDEVENKLGQMDTKVNEVDSKIELLTDMLEGMLVTGEEGESTSNSEQIPVCPGAIMSSFKRFVKGGITAKHADSQGVTSSLQTCAELCISDKKTCFGFSFHPKTFLCEFAKVAGARIVPTMRGNRYFERKMEC